MTFWKNPPNLKILHLSSGLDGFLRTISVAVIWGADILWWNVETVIFSLFCTTNVMLFCACIKLLDISEMELDKAQITF